jgi:Cu+-exporting ATPase
MPEVLHNHSAATAARTELIVSGMDCSNCARHVTEAIQSVAGVHSAMVNLEGKTASVRWNSGVTQNPAALVDAITEAGYSATIKEAASTGQPHDHSEHRLAGWEFTLWVGILGTLPLMIGEWVFNLGMMPWFQWVAFVLAVIVQVLAGAQFYRGAWNQLKIGNSNMDTLVALGSTTAFAYSTWALFSGHGGHVYFMESASIITLISLGHWMESRVSVRASGALRKLLNLAPQTTRRQNADGSEADVAVSELNIGDVVALRPGDRVPTDGEVISGDSAVDEAMLTGESVPVDKTKGAKLYAGTVNLNGRLLMRVIATGEATALAHIIAAVQRAQTSRANIQRLGDRVSSVFVPIVVTIALGAALWWGLAPESAASVHAWLSQFLWHAHAPEGRLAAAFIIAAAVLIIACPCAMGLATPTAIMAGSNAAAQRGILIRDGVALEKAGEVTAVIFDKTGTLTVGKPEVVQNWRADSGSNAIELAASLARHSTHPISHAVAKLSSRRTESREIGEQKSSPALPAKLEERAGERRFSLSDLDQKPLSPALSPLSGGAREKSASVVKSFSDDVALSDWEEVRGSGVQGRTQIGSELRAVKLGSLKWLRDSAVDLAPGEAFIREWSGQGATIVGLAAEKRLIALFAVKDTVKAGSASVVAELNSRGFKTFLLTGDNALTAASIAKQAGIKAENVFAEVRPEEKAGFVESTTHLRWSRRILELRSAGRAMWRVRRRISFC